MKFQTSFDSTNDAVTLLDRKYRLLVDSANEAIVVVKEGMLRLTNPMTRIMTGYSEEAHFIYTSVNSLINFKH